MDYQPRIMISGETAGTGASTTAKLLAEQFNLPNVSGGKYFRGIANRFDKHIRDNEYLSIAENYQVFLHMYQNAYNSGGIDEVNQLIGDGLLEGSKGNILEQFNTAIKNDYSRTHNLSKVWDYVVEKNTIRDALSQPGFVWEGKIAILALQLDQMQEVIPENEYSNNPYLNILLQVNSYIAAKRVGQRETRQVEVKEINDRKKHDYERYSQLYTIRGKAVRHSDLKKYSDIVINTESLEPALVRNKALTTYLKKIENVGSIHPSLAIPLINNIRTALSSF